MAQVLHLEHIDEPKTAPKTTYKIIKIVKLR